LAQQRPRFWRFLHLLLDCSQRGSLKGVPPAQGTGVRERRRRGERQREHERQRERERGGKRNRESVRSPPHHSCAMQRTAECFVVCTCLTSQGDSSHLCSPDESGGISLDSFCQVWPHHSICQSRCLDRLHRRNLKEECVGARRGESEECLKSMEGREEPGASQQKPRIQREVLP
ncbi:hypothetical protein SKAU_G00123600, partial [Synaphobranchus kaupii]